MVYYYNSVQTLNMIKKKKILQVASVTVKVWPAVLFLEFAGVILFIYVLPVLFRGVILEKYFSDFFRYYS